jgi:hypothetical protein
MIGITRIDFLPNHRGGGIGLAEWPERAAAADDRTNSLY